MKITGIYQIQSKCKPERIYIGSSVNIHKRKIKHFGRLRGNKHENSKLQNHFNKYGEFDLVFIIVELCLPEYLIIREQFYIDLMSPFFNICPTAGSSLGRKHSDLSKLRISKAKKGTICSEETRLKLSEAGKGRILSEESKHKISESKIGKEMPWMKNNKLFAGHNHSEESRLKLSESHKGHRHSEETKKKIGEGNKGKVRSKEANRKNSEARKGKPTPAPFKKGNIPWNKGLKIKNIIEQAS